MRKWLIGLGSVLAVVLAVVAVPVGLIASAFIGSEPLVPGNELADGKVITVFDTYVACFLIDVGDGAWVLVDGCKEHEATAIVAALAERGATLGDLDAILLTHGHEDHIGASYAAPMVPVRSMAAEIPQLEGKEPFAGPLPGAMGRIDTQIRVTEPLTDGEVFQIGDTQFEAFAIPGHTAGSVAILVHGVLFVGDSAAWKSAGHFVPGPWIFSDDVPQNTASLRALATRLAPRAAEIDWIAPAHTGPVAGLEPLSRF